MEKTSCELRVASCESGIAGSALRVASKRIAFNSQRATRNAQLITRNSFLATRNPQLATSPTGFTLIELMLSLAMVLILILGINYVFRTAADTVSTGQMSNSISRDSQSAQPLLFNDFANISKNPPAFIISSQFVTQFLNEDDAKTSTDPSVIVVDPSTQYLLSNPVTPLPAGITSTLSPAVLNFRDHRADMVKFFVHGTYPRRTGPDGTFVAADSSNDAFVEIGHAALPANSPLTGPFAKPTPNPPTVPIQYFGPSSAFNNSGSAGTFTTLKNLQVVSSIPRTGAYASDWVLARRLTLLKDPSTITTAGDYFYKAAATPAGIDDTTAYGANVSPLGYGVQDNQPNPNPQLEYSQSSRYDLAGVTPETFDRTIANAILGWQNGAYAGGSLWWNPLVYQLPVTQTQSTPPQYAAMTAPYLIPPYVVQYYNLVPEYSAPDELNSTASKLAFSPNPILTTPAQTDPGLWYNRPQCDPTIQAPLTAASIAQMAPYFLQHCSQFVVEYAGDYMQQNATGDMTGVGPDGQIDFYLDANGNKHIRWYGMPRSSTGVAHVDGPAADTSGSNVVIRGYDNTKDKTSIAGLLNYFTDVIPLRDYYTMWFDSQAGNPAAGTTLYVPPWEVDVNFDPTRDYTTPANVYAGAGKGNGILFNDPENPPRYVAAWHDDMPAMIRILIKVDDPNNKVKDGPWYEYVFRLK